MNNGQYKQLFTVGSYNFVSEPFPNHLEIVL